MPFHLFYFFFVKHTFQLNVNYQCYFTAGESRYIPALHMVTLRDRVIIISRLFRGKVLDQSNTDWRGSLA